MTLTFTPTTPRAVEPVDAETYFERLAVGLKNSNMSGWEYVKDDFGLEIATGTPRIYRVIRGGEDPISFSAPQVLSAGMAPSPLDH